MYKYAIARQLATKRVITNRGDELGRLVDLIIDEDTGVIESALIELDRDSRFLKATNIKDRTMEIPYSAVVAISDVVIVDERELGH